MDNFANLKPAERRPYFEEAANHRNSTTTAVKKTSGSAGPSNIPSRCKESPKAIFSESVGCKLKFLGLRGWLQEETGGCLT